MNISGSVMKGTITGEQKRSLNIKKASFHSISFLSRRIWVLGFFVWKYFRCDTHRLHVHGYHGNAGDSMTLGENHDNQPFSTHDRDHDSRFYDNCAEHYHGAWWFKSCFQSHLNGRYYQKVSWCGTWQREIWQQRPRCFVATVSVHHQDDKSVGGGWHTSGGWHLRGGSQRGEVTLLWFNDFTLVLFSLWGNESNCKGGKT